MNSFHPQVLGIEQTFKDDFHRHCQAFKSQANDWVSTFGNGGDRKNLQFEALINGTPDLRIWRNKCDTPKIFDCLGLSYLQHVRTFLVNITPNIA